MTILKIVIVLVVLAMVYILSDILALVFASLVFAAAISPLIDRMQRYRFPRWVTVVLVYIIFLGILTAVIYLLVPLVVNEIQSISANLPSYYDQLVSMFKSFEQSSPDNAVLNNLQNFLTSAEDQLGQMAGSLFSTAGNVFGGLLSLVVFLVITFYMLVEESGVKRLIHSIVPTQYQPYLVQLVNRIQQKLGHWLRGQLILCVIVGLLVYIGLTILGVKYALILAIIAGLLEFVPIIGPFLAGVPAVVLTATSTQSIFKVFLVVLLYLLVQILENYLIYPKVMQKSVGLNPVIIIIAMLIGAKLVGIIGVVLAVPIATILSIILKDVFNMRADKETQLE